jgi:hypothetical protein
MSAQLIPRYRRVLDELKEQVQYDRYPIERITLEGEECVRWIAEEDTKDTITGAMLHAISDFDAKKLAKCDALIAKLMIGTMTVDELCEWRDMQRSSLIDYCSRLARRKVELELGML